MKKIYRDNTHSLTVGESKRLVIGALPTELGVPVFASRNEQGEIIVDSVTMGEPVNTCFQAQFIDIDFLPICQQQGITPRHKYRPVFTDYPGTVEQDAYYTITHDEFVKLAKLYDTTVEIETASETNTATLKPLADEIDFTMVATRKELIDAFGKFTDMNMTWFDNLTDTPKLKAARKFTGQGGRHSAEPLFCPYEVMQWLADPKRRKGKPLSNQTAWRLLKGNFSKVYNQYSIGDPNSD
jgi:hypothetical protein